MLQGRQEAVKMMKRLHKMLSLQMLVFSSKCTQFRQSKCECASRIYSPKLSILQYFFLHKITLQNIKLNDFSFRMSCLYSWFGYRGYDRKWSSDWLDTNVLPIFYLASERFRNSRYALDPTHLYQHQLLHRPLHSPRMVKLL